MKKTEKEDLLIQAWGSISSELTKLRDEGLKDDEIFNFGLAVINHFNPEEISRLQKLSDQQDALWREANDL